MTIENKIDMKRINIIMIIILLVCFAGGIKAQSIRWADTNIGFVKKTDENIYKSEPSENLFFKISDNKMWTLIYDNAVLVSEDLRGYCEYSDNRYSYYNREGDIIGYYSPGDNKYFSVSGNKRSILKETLYATYSEGSVMAEEKELFKVDGKMAPEIVGFFLFMH